MKQKPTASAGAGVRAALRFDPQALPIQSPVALAESRLLGALHAEFSAALGPAEATVALLQIGCLLGLVDGLRAVDATELRAGREVGAVLAPPLAMSFRTRPSPTRGALEIRGLWPDRREASARLAALGQAARAACHLSAGYTSGWLSGTLGADLLALETSCCGAGAEQCSFVAREAETWRATAEHAACELLDALPFEFLRDLARKSLRSEPAPARNGAFDPEAAAIHIWGPVMVIPFGGSEEALRAVELIGHDPGARDVSVVILDLTGAVIDEAFGAVALEQIVEAIEMWGAEAILAGVSPASKRVIAGLESQPLAIHQGVDAAVASAFRIAQSQRRLV